MVAMMSSGLPPRSFTLSPMPMTVPRKMKLTPCMDNRPEPMGPHMLTCMKVPIPPTNKAMLMR